MFFKRLTVIKLYRDGK